MSANLLAPKGEAYSRGASVTTRLVLQATPLRARTPNAERRTPLDLTERLIS